MSTFTKPLKKGNRIRICRTLARYTQEELSYLLGIPTTTLSKWENRSQTPSIHYAIGLSVALHRLVDEIFSDYRNEWVKIINQRAQILENKKSKKITNDNDKR